ncbi:MAG: HEPN domain-containing protein [Candidatus Doudnabacteria bacterium]|nr:HEPN domain-containing protein [Candidatus Doudnabacteria bacterium]
MEEYIAYMFKTSKEEWQAAEYLLAGKKYAPCLFFCHLAIEKILKAVVAKQTQKLPPPTHNLLELIRFGNIKISSRKWELLETISRFNLDTRYAAEKQAFYFLCTTEYSTHYFIESKKIYSWLSSRMKYHKRFDRK